ncbi:MAG: lipid-A-disaccharide synthase [Synechococcales cyanobacterium]
MAKHILICTGEVSGDLQGSYLIRALRRRDPTLRITAIGGKRMEAAGSTLMRDTTRISSIGLVEALPFILPTLITTARIRRFLREDRPDLAVLIDYIGVNSYILGILRQVGIPAVYYIAPQDWVWSPESRLSYQVSDHARLVLSIFPEEARYYEQKGANVRWVGHPFIDVLPTQPDRQGMRQKYGVGPDEKWVLLLPASRRQEVQYVAPVLFHVATLLRQRLPNIRFSLGLSNPAFRDPLLRQLQRYPIHCDLIEDTPQAAMAGADLVLSKSGTVNLEAGILGIPQIIIYRVNPLTYWIGKYLLRLSIPYMCPVNLVQMRPIVPEFFQDAAQPEVIAELALELLQDSPRRHQMIHDYQTMKQALGSPGVLDRAATAILDLLDSPQSSSPPAKGQ